MELRRQLRARVLVTLATAAPIFATLFSVLALSTPPAKAAQTAPYLVNFQGRLTDNAGNVLSDGYYNIRFRLWTLASGGSNVWQSDRVYGAADYRVQVTSGLFNIQFGDTTKGDPALSPSLFATNPNLYLEVELPTPATATCASNGCAAWTEGAMAPRQPLASAPHAMNADTLDGMDADGFVQLTPATQQTGSINISGGLQAGGNLQTTGAIQGATATYTGANTLTLGTSGPSGNTGAILFRNATNANTVTLQSGQSGSVFALTLPATLTAAGDCLKDTTGAGVLGFASCSTGITLQTVYDNSTSPATITTTSATKDVVVKSGAGFNSATAFQVVPDGTATPAMNVDTQNSRVGIGTAAPAEALDVAGAVRVGTTTATNAGTIRFNGTAFQGYDGTSWLSLGSAATFNVVANQLQTVYKTADQTVNNSITLVDDSQLFFDVGPNETWTYHFNISADGATTTDFRFSLSAPSGATCNWAASEAENGESAANLACGSTTTVMSASGASVYDQYTIDGYVTTGATGGSVRLRWAQFTAGASNSIVRTGSFVQAVQDSGGDLNPFIQGGNAFGATAQLGTTDANALSIITNGTEAINVSAAQNVGIGTASGGARLDVNGDVAVRAMAAPAVAPAGQGRIYFDSGTGRFRVSENGSGYTDLLGGSGANTALSNLAAVNINTSLLTSSANTIDLASSTNPFRSGYFGTSIQTPQLAAANNVDLSLQSTGTGDLNLSAGSGILNLAAGTVRTSGTTSLTFDLSSALASTLYVANSNGSNVANLDVSGSLALGAGQQITIGGSQISSANLANDAAITKQGNTFNGTSQLVQTTSSGELPALSGANLTSLDPSVLTTGSGAVALGSAAATSLTLTSGDGVVALGSNTLRHAGNALAVDLPTPGPATLSITNSNGSNLAHLDVSGGVTVGAGQGYAVGSSSGAAATCSGGQVLQNQVVVGGIVTGGTCGTGGGSVTLQDVYDNSASPATITTSSATKGVVIQSGTGFNSATALQVIPDGTTTATLTVDTQNARVGIGTNSPSYMLDVDGTVNATGAYYSGGTAGIARTCSGGQVLQNTVVAGGIVTGGTCATVTGGTGGGTSQIGALVAQVYDSAGGTDANNATPTVIPWGAETRVDAGITHSTTTNSSRVTLDDAGWYRITYSVSSQNQTATNHNALCRVRFNGATYNAASASYSYARDATDSRATNTGSALVQASAGDYYEVVCAQAGSAGAGLTIAGQSWTLVEKLDGAAPFTANGGIITQTATTDRLQLNIGETGDAGLEIQGIASQTANFLEIRRESGSTNVIFAVDAAGALQFGPGGVTALDTSLYRTAAGVLRTDGQLQVGTLATATTTPICVNGSGALASCSTSWGVADLQGAYDGSTSPQITLGAGGGLVIHDSNPSVGGNLLAVQDNAGTTNYLAVTTAGISTSGSIDAGGSLALGAGQQITIGGSQISSANLANDAAITKQGNTFNGTSQLVQTTSSGELPALSGANLTSLNPTNLVTGSGAVALASGGTSGLSLTSASGAITLGASSLQRAGSGLTFDLANASTSTFTFANSNGSNVANVDISGSLSIGGSGVFAVGSSLGSGVTCSGGQLLQNQTVVGGIVTGGTCTAAGATTALSNLTTTSINQSLIANANNTFDIGASGTAWRTGYFATSLQSPIYTGTGATTQFTGDNAVSLSSGAGSTLSVDSGTTGDLSIGAGANAKTITIGNSTSGTNVNIRAGSTLNLQSGGNITLGVADATATQLVLDTGTADPTGSNGGIYYNSSLSKFRCYENATWKDCIPGLAVRSFLDTTADAVVDSNTTSYWDNSAENNNTRPNITPSATDKEIFGILTMETQSTGTADLEVTARIERSTAGATTCNTGTAVGAQAGTFASNTSARKATAVSFIDAPASTSTQYFNICSDTDTVGTTGNITRLRMSLFEVDNSNADLAEVYPTNDRTIHDGEVVTMDPGLPNGVKRATAANDRSVVGVISTSPALLIGGKGGGGVTGAAVALSGRVPVLVTDENGPVKAGDPLATSSTPGMAMRATQAGYVIGRAMQDAPSTGQSVVMAFVGTHYYTPGQSVESEVPASLAELVKTDPAYLDALKHFKADSHGNLLASIAAGAKFAWANTGGQVVAWINDAGEAFFKSVQASLGNFSKLVTGNLVFDKSAQIAGQSAIPAGQTEIFIQSDKIAPDSVINLTPNGKTNGLVLYVKERRPGQGFVVGVEEAGKLPTPTPLATRGTLPTPTPSPSEPIPFNWLVVNQE